MQFANFEEYWEALGRLYDETLEIKESIKQLRQSDQANREYIAGLAEAAQRLLGAIEKQHEVVTVHERRLDRTDITVEAILEDLRRHREQRPSQ